MPLPADERRLEPLGQVWAHVQPSSARPAAQPLDAAAGREVDAELRHVEGDDARGLIRVEHDVGAHLVRAAHDRLDVLDLAVLEQHVADRHEQRALVDRVDDRRVVLHRDYLEPGLRLIQVAHRGEVRLLVHDAVARAGGAEAREDDHLGDGHVLVHDDAARRCADDAPDLVADGDGHVPPAFAPGADTALAPHARVLEQPVLDCRRHRREGVVDQVGAVAEDREAVAIREQLLHL